MLTLNELKEIWLIDIQEVELIEETLLQGTLDFLNNTDGMLCEFDLFQRQHELFCDAFEDHPQFDLVYLALGL